MEVIKKREQKGPREQYLFKDRPRESTLTEGGKNKKDLGKVQGVCTHGIAQLQC